jgi:hypothetical protein
LGAIGRNGPDVHALVDRLEEPAEGSRARA